MNDVESAAAAVVDAGYRVHVALGPGLLESAYQRALAIELKRRGYGVQTEVPITGAYLSEPLGLLFRADIVVDGRIIIEVKSVDRVTNRHRLQLRTYIRLSDTDVGFLINFNEALIKDGIRRVSA